MTTAHKPTWQPAIATKNQGGWDSAGAVSHQFSVRDMPQQMTLKKRKFGQGSQSELLGSSAGDLKAQLERKEHEAAAKKRGALAGQSRGAGGGHAAGPVPLQITDSVVKAIEDKFDDSDEFDSSSDEDSDDDSDDDAAEQAALMAELARIKKEREEEARQKEKERLAAEAAGKEEGMVAGNPLLVGGGAGGGGGALKKKWHDDVVFKNQARDAPELKKRYINDTVRNDFHRKFMTRYIK